MNFSFTTLILVANLLSKGCFTRAAEGDGAKTSKPDIKERSPAKAKVETKKANSDRKHKAKNPGKNERRQAKKAKAKKEYDRKKAAFLAKEAARKKRREERKTAKRDAYKSAKKAHTHLIQDIKKLTNELTEAKVKLAQYEAVRVQAMRCRVVEKETFFSVLKKKSADLDEILSLLKWERAQGGWRVVNKDHPSVKFVMKGICNFVAVRADYSDPTSSGHYGGYQATGSLLSSIEGWNDQCEREYRDGVLELLSPGKAGVWRGILSKKAIPFIVAMPVIVAGIRDVVERRAKAAAEGKSYGSFGYITNLDAKQRAQLAKTSGSKVGGVAIPSSLRVDKSVNTDTWAAVKETGVQAKAEVREVETQTTVPDQTSLLGERIRIIDGESTKVRADPETADKTTQTESAEGTENTKTSISSGSALQPVVETGRAQPVRTNPAGDTVLIPEPSASYKMYLVETWMETKNEPFSSDGKVIVIRNRSTWRQMHKIRLLEELGEVQDRELALINIDKGGTMGVFKL
jgi:hypothetical protein